MMWSKFRSAVQGIDILGVGCQIVNWSSLVVIVKWNTLEDDKVWFLILILGNKPEHDISEEVDKLVTKWDPEWVIHENLGISCNFFCHHNYLLPLTFEQELSFLSTRDNLLNWKKYSTALLSFKQFISDGIVSF